MIDRKKSNPQFDIDDRDFNIKAWYLEDKDDALIEIRYKTKLIKEFLFPAYKIWSLAIHFSNYVDIIKKEDESEYIQSKI